MLLAINPRQIAPGGVRPVERKLGTIVVLFVLELLIYRGVVEAVFGGLPDALLLDDASNRFDEADEQIWLLRQHNECFVAAELVDFIAFDVGGDMLAQVRGEDVLSAEVEKVPLAKLLCQLFNIVMQSD